MPIILYYSIIISSIIQFKFQHVLNQQLRPQMRRVLKSICRTHILNSWTVENPFTEQTLPTFPFPLSPPPQLPFENQTHISTFEAISGLILSHKNNFSLIFNKNINCISRAGVSNGVRHMRKERGRGHIYQSHSGKVHAAGQNNFNA